MGAESHVRGAPWPYPNPDPQPLQDICSYKCSVGPEGLMSCTGKSEPGAAAAVGGCEDHKKVHFACFSAMWEKDPGYNTADDKKFEHYPRCETCARFVLERDAVAPPPTRLHGALRVCIS